MKVTRALLLYKSVVSLLLSALVIRPWLKQLLGWIIDLVLISLCLSDLWHSQVGCVLWCAASLRDDIRSYLPELLPRFVSLFGTAERSGSWEMVRPGLDTLEAIGPALEAHLQLLLPALASLICQSNRISSALICSQHAPLHLQHLNVLLQRHTDHA